MNKISICDCRNYADLKNGTCLSINYRYDVKLLWQCENGHQWYSLFNNVKHHNKWCPYCAANAKYTIKDCNDFASNYSGRCLSQKYSGAHKKLLWQCKYEHVWSATFNNIKNGKSWCPHCSGVNKKTIQECIDWATAKNGKCLSEQYDNVSEKLLWQCENGHVWSANFHSIKNSKTWCPYCSNCVKHTIQDCIDVALLKDGKCLSADYKNTDEKLLWQCKNGHVWKASFYRIKYKNAWCPHCNGNAKHTIDDCKTIAANNNGKCLSIEYVNAKTSIIWQCEKNHIWKATTDNVKRGTWCPYCSNNISKAQEEIYLYLIDVFPELNIIYDHQNVLGRFDLDIYMPELKIGIEYDGEYYHYSEWAIASGALEKMCQKDQLCKERGIKLLRIRERDWKINKELELQKIIDFVMGIS